jgi:hypothetical protein
MRFIYEKRVDDPYLHCVRSDDFHSHPKMRDKARDTR